MITHFLNPVIRGFGHQTIYLANNVWLKVPAKTGVCALASLAIVTSVDYCILNTRQYYFWYNPRIHWIYWNFVVISRSPAYFCSCEINWELLKD